MCQEVVWGVLYYEYIYMSWDYPSGFGFLNDFLFVPQPG